MATPTDSEGRKKPGKTASIAVWLLMAMLVLGLGGFGVTNFGGGVTAIGKVGQREIDVNAYARALRQELDAFSAQIGQPISLQQAQSLGLDRQVLQNLVTRTALDNETAHVGISAGDEVIATQITKMPAFQGPGGRFDRETYRYALQNSSLTEKSFETTMREDMARSILQGAIVGGFAAPAALIDTLYAYTAERRGFSLLRLDEADLAAPVAEADEADLIAFHTANIAQFTRPEAKRLTYVALLPEAVAAGIELDEATVRARYDERINDYKQPEKRLVERLVFGSAEDAAAAKARLDGGETFEALVAERGLELSDVDLGDVGREELGAAADAVFALTEPGVVGPLDSDLGPALYRMNAVLAAQEVPFEAARDALAQELALDAARREISDRLESVNDDLAGGATLEEVAGTQKMILTAFDYVPGGENDDPLAGYPDFRAAADAVQEGDFPEAILLDDGGLVALRLDAVVPPTRIPFAEVRDKVAAAWRVDAVEQALSARAVEIKAAIEGGASIGSQGIVDVTPAITRDGFVEGAPAALLVAVFQMAAGDVRVIEDAGFVGLVRLDSVTPAATEGPDAEAVKAVKAAIAAQAEQAIAQDAFAAFTNALTSEAGITLDQAAINAVHAQFN